jgi:hypothetical protein
MLILRAFLALLAGFLTMALMVAAATAVLAKYIPEWTGTPGQPRAGYIFVNLGYSFAAAIAGGYVTAWIAKDNPLVHALALALIVLLLAAVSAVQQRGQQPIWYQLLLVAVTPAGVVLGGLFRLKVMGI